MLQYGACCDVVIIILIEKQEKGATEELASCSLMTVTQHSKVLMENSSYARGVVLTSGLAAHAIGN